MNDQHPFDVAPDDERRPAADAAPETDSSGRTAAEPDGGSGDAPATATDAGGAPATDAVPAEEDEPRAKRKHHRIAALSVAAAVIFTAGAGGGAAASLALARSSTTATVDGGAGTQQGTNGGQGFQNGFGGRNGLGSGGPGSSGSGTSTAKGSTTATSDQVAGLVTIVTRLGYENGEAAGTGIILTSGGRILTNNHVIDGATAIEVTDESTGRSYTADVVGTNATKDVAVLQLEDASGLRPATIARSGAAVGDEVTAVGNANGTGTLSAAEGTVTALDQTITTSSDGTTEGETLRGLIEISADVVSGDSGGAVEDADGDVIGVTTAASSGTADVTGYAIPIATALSIARQIVAGDDTDEITIGLPAFLGVSLDPDASGAVVAGVLDGTAAAGSGLAEGDTITAVDGTAVSSRDALSRAIAAHAPGDEVRIAWTDADGADHSAVVALTEGPAD